MDRRPATRSSLACIPCRNQHLRCDAVSPSCSRCQGLSRPCSYPESRRTGRSRARKPASQSPLNVSTPTQSLLEDCGLLQTNSNQRVFTTVSDFGSSPGFDTLLNLYYQRFHCSHPFVLPKAALQDILTAETPSAQQLISVMRYIGSFYTDPPSNQNHLVDINTGSSDVVDGFSVQATLLMALAKSMCSEQVPSEELLTKAIQQAKSIGMHTKSFADAVEAYNPVLAESWRRTWWMIYVVDSNFSVIRRDHRTTLNSADYDVSLPCEDHEYCLMEIPRGAASWQDYCNREFALEDKNFSSFAYFIDANDIFVSSLRASYEFQDISDAEILCDNLEATIAGWFLMLPATKRGLCVKPASVDQLMFQAYMMMYTSITYIHRPLSTLRYNVAEDISSCGSPPPPLASATGVGSALDGRTHLEKLLEAIQKQNQCLITLPVEAVQISPFTICMIACCTIAHLVACKSALGPREANVARSRIRVCIGTLRHYEDVWPRAKKILRELKCIAHLIMEAVAVPQLPLTGCEMLIEQESITVDLLEEEWLHTFARDDGLSV
ncbi:Zn(2)-C6 fungal-type domain-containing protein [Fusarium keratoplasticum]|nr:Zn(2)-C6 fungal-type domain-containing protein [Fusarium keratoplasticum]